MIPEFLLDLVSSAKASGFTDAYAYFDPLRGCWVISGSDADGNSFSLGVSQK